MNLQEIISDFESKFNLELKRNIKNKDNSSIRIYNNYYYIGFKLKPDISNCNYFDIFAIHVKGNYKNLGIGSALIDKLIDFSKDFGFNKIQASDVYNTDFIKKCGFKRDYISLLSFSNKYYKYL